MMTDDADMRLRDPVPANCEVPVEMTMAPPVLDAVEPRASPPLMYTWPPPKLADDPPVMEMVAPYPRPAEAPPAMLI